MHDFNSTQLVLYNHSHIHLITVQTLIVSITSTTATSISLSWRSSGGSGVQLSEGSGAQLSTGFESYDVMWKRDNTRKCSEKDEGNITITDDTNSYTITGLEEDSYYEMTVTVHNVNESAVSGAITAVTDEAGKRVADTVSITKFTSNSLLSFSFICPSYLC